ncbi:MAG: hypothetical protein QOF67_850 [Mycobacterium sp.]|nr:hypothetical protein [Mycobacterium sp.]
MPSIAMRIASLLGAVVMTAAVSSCHEHASIPDAQAPGHNAADVTFAQKMIPHHQQALDMAAMVPPRTTNRELIVMAKHIALDQQAQIDTLQRLLGQWGEPAAADHMGHGGMGMDGMVDAATMDRLPGLKDTEFDELWLRSMIVHHQGAVAMAEPEVAHGEDPTAVRMAKVIVDWQQLEIGRMHAMLGPSE